MSSVVEGGGGGEEYLSSEILVSVLMAHNRIREHEITSLKYL